MKHQKGRYLESFDKFSTINDIMTYLEWHIHNLGC